MLKKSDAQPSRMGTRISAALRSLERKDPIRAQAIRDVLADLPDESSLGLTAIPEELDKSRLRFTSVLRPTPDLSYSTAQLHAENGSFIGEDALLPEDIEDGMDFDHLSHAMEAEIDPDTIHIGQVDPAFLISDAERARMAKLTRRAELTRAALQEIACVKRGFTGKENGEHRPCYIPVQIRKPVSPYLSDRAIALTEEFDDDAFLRTRPSKRGRPGKSKTGRHRLMHAPEQ